MDTILLTDIRTEKNIQVAAGSRGIVPALWPMPVALETLENRMLLSAVSLVPTADAYVRDGSYSNTNFGSAGDLQVKAATPGSGYTRHSYLKFDLSGQDPIQSAILQIYGNESSVAPALAISAHAVTSNSWSQTAIDFNNAPAISSATLTNATISGTNSLSYYLNLTSYFQQQQAAGHATVSLALEGNASTAAYADFNSTSGANEPLLLLQTQSPTPVPTPTTTTYSPAADAYVQDGSAADTNFGSSTQLQVKQGNLPGFTRISYLTFNLSGINSGSTIESAMLSVYGQENGSSPVQVDAQKCRITRLARTPSPTTMRRQSGPALNPEASLHRQWFPARRPRRMSST